MRRWPKAAEAEGASSSAQVLSTAAALAVEVLCLAATEFTRAVMGTEISRLRLDTITARLAITIREGVVSIAATMATSVPTVVATVPVLDTRTDDPVFRSGSGFS